MSKNFKYHLNREIELLPRKWTILRIQEILKDKYGISRNTFQRDRNILQEDKSSIPSERLDVYAMLFGKSSDDLKNYTIDGISLSDIDPDDDHFEDFKNISGLS